MSEFSNNITNPPATGGLVSGDLVVFLVLLQNEPGDTVTPTIGGDLTWTFVNRHAFFFDTLEILVWRSTMTDGGASPAVTIDNFSTQNITHFAFYAFRGIDTTDPIVQTVEGDNGAGVLTLTLAALSNANNVAFSVVASDYKTDGATPGGDWEQMGVGESTIGYPATFPFGAKLAGGTTVTWTSATAGDDLGGFIFELQCAASNA